MKKKRKTIKGSDHLFEAGDFFACNYPTLTFFIPQEEVQTNPDLKLKLNKNMSL
jgi:hypothetical protein